MITVGGRVLVVRALLYFGVWVVVDAATTPA